MRNFLRVSAIVACVWWAGTALAYELVEVRSGDVLLVRHEGETIALKLGGVWVPAPSGQGVEAQYRGDEARRFVEETLFTEAAFIEELEARSPGSPVVEVRIRVGEAGDRDLAVLLAEAGLALTERTSAADREHADAIYQAERAARRAERGMHDGGLMGFVWSQEQQWDLGTQMVATSLLRTKGGAVAVRGSMGVRSRRSEMMDTTGWACRATDRRGDTEPRTASNRLLLQRGCHRPRRSTS
jgi:endonuclease YncB( thermonuclease family)